MTTSGVLQSPARNKLPKWGSSMEAVEASGSEEAVAAARASAAQAEMRAHVYGAANVDAATSKGAVAASAAATKAAARKRRLAGGSAGQSLAPLVDGGEDDLQLLEARMLQWSYLNVRAAAAFDAQEHRAHAVLHGAYQAVEELKLQVHAEQLQLAHAKYCKEVDDVLDLFDKSLLPVSDLVPSLAAHHHTLSKAVEVTTHQLPTRGVDTHEDPQKLARALIASARLLDQLNVTVEVSMPGLQPYAQGLSKLDQTTREELQSLAQCRALLSEIVALETRERSLRIQRKQTQRLFEIESRKQRMAGLSAKTVVPRGVADTVGAARSSTLQQVN